MPVTHASGEGLPAVGHVGRRGEQVQPARDTGMRTAAELVLEPWLGLGPVLHVFLCAISGVSGKALRALVDQHYLI